MVLSAAPVTISTKAFVLIKLNTSFCFSANESGAASIRKLPFVGSRTLDTHTLSLHVHTHAHSVSHTHAHTHTHIHRHTHMRCLTNFVA